MSDLSRVEQLLKNALGEDIYEVTPQSKVEVLLQQLNEYIEEMGETVPSRPYAVPEDYGAVGDGETDDYEAIQAAIDSGLSVYLPGQRTYYVSQPIVISGYHQNIQFDATVISDAEYVVEIRNAVYSRMYFTRLENDVGGCIHFNVSVSDPEESVAYSKFGFGVLIATTECIKIDTANGQWCNENQFECGQFRRGTWAVYADDRSNSSVDYSCIEGNAFYNAGIEGTTNGFFLGRVTNTYIINPRHSESGHLVTTAGKCSINLLLKNVATEQEVILSNETRGTMIACEYYKESAAGRIDGGFFYTIVNGHIMNTGHTLYYNTYADVGELDLTGVQFTECPTAFNVNVNTDSIKLNECYGVVNGINSILIGVNETSSRTLTIKKNSTVIAVFDSNITDYAWVKMEWIPTVDIWCMTVLQECATT